MKHDFTKTVYMDFKPKHLISISDGDKLIEDPTYVDGTLSVKFNGSEDLYIYRYEIGSNTCNRNEELEKFANSNCLDELEFWDNVIDTLIEGSCTIIAKVAEQTE